jgi:predicted DNA-binding transcriptional regulator YafY
MRCAKQRCSTCGREVAKVELDEYLKSGYGIFAGRGVDWASLKFTPQAARWVSSQSWHSNQRTRFEKDGSYVLEVPYADDRELVMEVLKFGPDVEVLAPEGLRRKVGAQLEAARKKYG